MSTSTSTPQGRARRADAKRNRARLVSVAAEAFEEHGIDASLEEIAHRAGVGIGTLYRHFPTREDLVEEVVHDGVVRLVRYSEELIDADDALDGLHRWLAAAVGFTASYRGLAASLADSRSGEGRLAEACHQQEAALAALFDRAQRAGRVRDDATVADALDLTSALAWIAERGGDGEDGLARDRERLLRLVVDAFRPPAR